MCVHCGESKRLLPQIEKRNSARQLSDLLDGLKRSTSTRQDKKVFQLYNVNGRARVDGRTPVCKHTHTHTERERERMREREKQTLPAVSLRASALGSGATSMSRVSGTVKHSSSCDGQSCV